MYPLCVVLSFDFRPLHRYRTSLPWCFLCLAQPVLKPKTDFQLFPLLGQLTMRKTKGIITYKQHSHWLPHKWLVHCSYLNYPVSWHNQKEQKKVKAVICCPCGFSQRTNACTTARLASSINTRLQRKLCNWDILQLYFTLLSLLQCPIMLHSKLWK